MSGARFVRADLHVHTYPDTDTEPRHTIDRYIAAAVDRGISVLGVTDHNAVDSVSDAIAAAVGHDLLVLPGIEVTTHQGHLLALFDPDRLTELTDFASAANLQLKPDALDESTRSSRSMLDLVGEIAERKGLAIPAHIDLGKGIAQGMNPSELVELLTHPGLAGLEFGTADALKTWFSDLDMDDNRKAAFRARMRNDELAQRGLARLMSSDAHSPEQVGRDRATRTLTRLRLDDLNFQAVRNALMFNPKARCKAEVVLPESYPRVVSAAFEGGFLDGVHIDLSPNLTSVIGGRGSGKSTALIAIRATVGAELSPDDDPDDPDRMPEKTTVTFVDRLGSERTATRHRGMSPVDESGAAVELALADLGQDESGRLAREYGTDGSELLDFIDAVVDLAPYRDEERRLLALLDDNAAEIRRTLPDKKRAAQLESDAKQLTSSLNAARKGKLEELVKWASVLAQQRPFIDLLDAEFDRVAAGVETVPKVELDPLADEHGVSLTTEPATKFVPGEGGLREHVETLNTKLNGLYAGVVSKSVDAAIPAREKLDEWRTTLDLWQGKLDTLKAELEAQGLKMQAGEVVRLAELLGKTQNDLAAIRIKDKQHDDALKVRKTLLQQLYTVWENLFQIRKASLKAVTRAANEASDGMLIHVSFTKEGMNADWCGWLTSQFQFRTPRVQQVAAAISPRDFITAWLKGGGIENLMVEGEKVFTEAVMQRAQPKWNLWYELFKLQTLRLEDAVTIQVQEQRTQPTRRAFDHLSAGQQRSVLLSLLLCADRSEPLILDQPEDHLDAQYIAGSVVRHLEMAKERRQVIIATHSANLTVLGDAELVVPMSSNGSKGSYTDAGAVDRPETREQVCALLEGGRSAYRRRGERYGFQFKDD